MINAQWRALIDGRGGVGAVKLALTASVLGLIGLSTTPEFRDHPLVKSPLHELRQYLPDALNQITQAMGG